MIKNVALSDDRKYKSYILNLKQQRYSSTKFLFNRINRELAISQMHKCPICNETLYNGEALEKHHIVAFKDGGTTAFGNLVLLHQPCHKSITHRKNEQDRKLIIENLQRYKTQHPSLLAQFIREKKEEGLSSQQVNEK
jgi:5-methylcytosine-specific restriction endonuclease McrA